MSRQYDVVANPDASDAPHRPYLVVFAIRPSIGLAIDSGCTLGRTRKAGRRPTNEPDVSIDGKDYWLATHELFAIEQHMLKSRVASLSDRHDAIMAALDFLFTGV